PVANMFCHPGKSASLFALALTLCCGCRLGQPVSASFASVKISGHTDEEIRQATRQVFTEAGYTSRNAEDGGMVFEREGTKGNQIAHGGWLEDEPVLE